MTFSRIVSSEQKRVLFEELEGGGGKGPSGIVAPGNGDYSSKARAARVFVCPPQPARAWPQALSHRLPRVRPPKSPAGDRVWAKSRCRHGGGRGCPGRLPGGGETAKERKMEWVSRDQRVSARGGRGRPLRCQFSPRMESPGGVRGGGCFLLRGLFWGLKQIKPAAAPRAPSSCAQQLSLGGR